MTELDTNILTELTLLHLEANPDTLRFRRIGTGKHNRSYWIESNQGRFVLRIAPADEAGFLFYERLMMRQEPALHDLIKSQTSIPVAEVIGFDFDRNHIDRDYLLMTALPGTPLSDAPALSRGQFNRTLGQVGDYVRQLHGLTAFNALDVGDNAFGYLGAHCPMAPQPDWTTAFRLMWHKLIDDVEACGSYTAAEADAMRDLLELYVEVFARPVEPSLLHMDIWSQNILIDNAGNVTGLVDFDRALWGDVEIEFAVLDYCGISEPAFWEGYGSPRDESQPALIRRHFYLLYEVQKYMPIRIWRRQDPLGAAQYKQESLALAAQLVPHR